MAKVLMKRILKLVLLLEIHRRPVSGRFFTKDPARTVLVFDYEQSKGRHNEVVDFGRAARCRKDDIPEMVIVRRRRNSPPRQRKAQPAKDPTNLHHHSPCHLTRG